MDIKHQYSLEDAEQLQNAVLRTQIDPSSVISATVEVVYARYPHLNRIVAGIFTLATKYYSFVADIVIDFPLG